MWKFKEEHSFEERKLEAEKISRFWPDKVPMVLEKWAGSALEEVPKSKLLCPKNYTYSQFLSCLRVKLRLPASSTLFVFLNKSKFITRNENVASYTLSARMRTGFCT
jgi:GABA(A) receptor-associated protein